MEQEDQWKEHKQKLLQDWHVAFKRGTDFDLWGQPLEAIDSYCKLATYLQDEAHPESLLFSDEGKKILNKITACLELRGKALQVPDRQEGISLADIKKIQKDLISLLSKSSQDFPLDVCSYLPSPVCLGNRRSPGENLSEVGSHATCDNLSEVLDDKDEMFHISKQAQGTLLAQPDPVPGQTLVTLRVECIGLKDPAQYIDPFLTISVKDIIGNEVLSGQDSPVSSCKQDSNLFFGVDVHLQKTLDQLPQGFVVFFEFKHYKPKKQKTSVKCWTCMEQDEIKEGRAILELYKKPTDYKRKKITLLTIKPLYLHVKLIFNG